ncbi:MAG: hydrolase [Dissulfurispiraceae bacterium]
MNKFFITRHNSILALIDIQDKLAAIMKSRDELVENCLHLIEIATLLKMPIVLTEQYPKGLGRTVEKIIKKLPVYEPFEKLTFSSCEERKFSDALRQHDKKTVILTGMEAHICILQTCIGLLEKGYDVHLVCDAVCSRTENNWKMAMEFMRDAGAVITSTETVLFQLLKNAGTDEFKIISKRIK